MFAEFDATPANVSATDATPEAVLVWQSMNDIKPIDMEKYLIDTSDWVLAPKKVQEEAEKSASDGTSTGIAKIGEMWWVVLATAGQGPAIVYLHYGDKD